MFEFEDLSAGFHDIISDKYTDSSSPKNTTHHHHHQHHSHNTSSTSSSSNTKPTNKSSSLKPIEHEYPKPAYSYSCFIAMALKNSRSGSLPVSEIYSFMCEHFPYFKTAPNGWKNSVRHNLSLNKCFEKIEKPITNGGQRKDCLWTMNPAKIMEMDEEVQKWSRKDPMAIRKAMVYPENLEELERGEMKHGSTGDSDEEISEENDVQSEDNEENSESEHEEHDLDEHLVETQDEDDEHNGATIRRRERAGIDDDNKEFDVEESSSPINTTHHHHHQHHSNNTSSTSSSSNTKPTTKSSSLKPIEHEYPKPAYSYSCLIAMALKNSRSGSLPVSEIYSFMCEHFPYFKTAPNGWKNSVRHNLLLNKCFEKIEKPITNGGQRKDCLWTMNPAKIMEMDEEVQKWSRKDPMAIRKTMVYPENLEELERGEMKHGSTGDSDEEISEENDVQSEDNEENSESEHGE